MERQHFKRARMMMAAIQAIIAGNHSELARMALIGNLGPYKSRGKGRGGVVRNFYGRTTPWGKNGRPKTERREMTRRRRQIERGILNSSNGLIREQG